MTKQCQDPMVLRRRQELPRVVGLVEVLRQRGGHRGAERDRLSVDLGRHVVEVERRYAT
jgi:hypothetical protein